MREVLGYNESAMHIGICTVSLRLHGNDNLKGKRRAIHSIVDRVRSKFNVAIAEVDDHEAWQRITLGLACVSTDKRHANSMLSNVVQYITRVRGEIELLDYEIEIIEGV